MLIILNCAHTQVDWVVCQNRRTEWSTAVCDSCVAQLGETDNPQPAGADKTATFLLRRLKIPSAGPCSYSLPSSLPGTLVVPLNGSSSFKQSLLVPITSLSPSVSSSYLSAVNGGLQRTPDQSILRLWPWPAVIISVSHFQQSEKGREAEMTGNTFIPLICTQNLGTLQNVPQCHRA